MSERIRGSYDDALYKSTYTLYTLLYYTLYCAALRSLRLSAPSHALHRYLSRLSVSAPRSPDSDNGLQTEIFTCVKAVRNVTYVNRALNNFY